MKYPIGTKYITSTKQRGIDIHTVVDFLTTTNIKNDVVSEKYVTSHLFCGQVVLNHDVCAVTIARGINEFNATLPFTSSCSKPK